MRIRVTGEPRGYRGVVCCLAGLGLLLAPNLCPAQVPSYTITTIAGTGTGGFAGDGGPATAAQLFDPCALLPDASGNLYIADEINYRVRKMALGGNISTYVGTGTAGDSGSTATSANIRNPCGLVLDGSGNLFFSDSTNHEVKKVTSAGAISTVAGTGTGGYAGDGHPAKEALLNTPMGLLLDAAGNLYIADNGNHVVRKVTTDGNITTFAGDGTAGYTGDGNPPGAARLDSPTGMAMDAQGNIYVADTFYGVIRKITPGGGTISTFAGNGFNASAGDGLAATKASLNNPRDVAVDAAGNVYIADTVGQRIRMVTTDGIMHTIAGVGLPGASGDGGPALQATLRFPGGVKVDAAGNVYIADTQNSEIRQLTPLPAAAPPSVKGVISASDFGALPAVASGSWIEIYGSNLAADSRPWTLADFTGNQAPTSLDFTSVTIGGQSAFLSWISSGQVNVQVPSGVPPGPQPLVVTTKAGSSAPFPITVQAAEPGFYAPPALLAGGKQYTAQYNDSTHTFVIPSGAVSGINARPAHPGDIIVLYGVGFGPVSPASPAGQVVPQLNSLTNPVQFSIGGVPAVSMYGGLAPQEIGLYQFNVIVPNVAPGDAVPLTFTQGGVSGTQTLYLAIQ